MKNHKLHFLYFMQTVFEYIYEIKRIFWCVKIRINFLDPLKRHRHCFNMPWVPRTRMYNACSNFISPVIFSPTVRCHSFTSWYVSHVVLSNWNVECRLMIGSYRNSSLQKLFICRMVAVPTIVLVLMFFSFIFLEIILVGPKIAVKFC